MNYDAYIKSANRGDFQWEVVEYNDDGGVDVEENIMPDMREIKEYIMELKEQIEIYEKWLKRHRNADVKEEFIVRGTIATLVEVKGDLQNRLDELI